MVAGIMSMENSLATLSPHKPLTKSAEMILAPAAAGRNLRNAVAKAKFGTIHYPNLVNGFCQI